MQVRSLCRGQNLFGYSPYPDNVVCEFLKEAVRSGSAPADAADPPPKRNKPHGAATTASASSTRSTTCGTW